MNEVTGFIKRELAPLNMSEAESKFNNLLKLFLKKDVTNYFLTPWWKGIKI